MGHRPRQTSAQLDLRVHGDVETLRGLVRQADVFSQGYRPGALVARGLAPEELAALRPGLVYVSLSAFGHNGPWASRRGFDTVVQTVSGMTIRQAEAVPGKTAGPQFYPVSAIDYCTGYLMAFGAMVALARRAREGGSWLVRISLAQVGKWMVDLGEVPAASLRSIPTEFTRERAGAVVDRERNALRPATAPEAGRAVVGNAAPLGTAFGSAWLSSPGVAIRFAMTEARSAERQAPRETPAARFGAMRDGA